MSRHRAPTTRLRWIPATAAGGVALAVGVLGALLWPAPAAEPLAVVQTAVPEPAPLRDLIKTPVKWVTR